MDGYTPGTFVCSNEVYHEKTKRFIKGFVVRALTPINDNQVIVRWTEQSGDGYNPEMDNQMVLMLKEHLQFSSDI